MSAYFQPVMLRLLSLLKARSAQFLYLSSTLVPGSVARPQDTGFCGCSFHAGYLETFNLSFQRCSF